MKTRRIKYLLICITILWLCGCDDFAIDKNPTPAPKGGYFQMEEKINEQIPNM